LKGSSAHNVEAAAADGQAIRALESTVWSLGALGPMLRRAQFDRDLLARRAGEHWAQATDLADALVHETGLSFRQAHHVVGRLVSDCLDAGISPSAVTPAMLDRAAEQTLGHAVSLSAGALQAALDPWHGVTVRTLLGGPSPATVGPLLDEARSAAEADARQLEAIEARLREADATLEQAVEAITNAGEDHVR
jgi:argininosuccinate lyase